MSSPPLELAHRIIDELYQKYSADEQVFPKMHNYICFRIPLIIEEMKRVNEERRIRNEQLTADQDTFIQAFLANNNYFYCAQTERFFYYDKHHYSVCKEDDILHHILTTITRDHNSLIPRKPQTKVYIMKRIKETTVFKSIPESETIQAVIDALSPALFSTKAAVKYFLTIVGDHLLKKTDDITHSYFAPSKSKLFLQEIAIAGQTLFGINPTGLFKHKYHGHGYKTIRLIKMNDTVSVESIWKQITAKHMLDILCVATHYSSRYGSADQYLENHCDEIDLIKYALYFRGKNTYDVVNGFIAYCIHNESGSTINISTMDYLWRKYLRDKCLPCVITSQSAIEYLQELLSSNYDSEKSVFKGLTSPYLSVIHQFNQFWDSTMTTADELSGGASLSEYEIDEIVMLYRKWCGTNYSNTLRISDLQMLDLIRTYRPAVSVQEDKYVEGILCNLWNKTDELDRFFIEFISESQQGGELRVFISIYDAYAKYQEQARHFPKKQTIGKMYFEKYVHKTMKDSIVDGQYISL